MKKAFHRETVIFLSLRSFIVFLWKIVKNVFSFWATILSDSKMYAAVEESSLQLLVMVESVNTIMLAVGLYLMYQGIEIGHPVYSILFSNLVSAFFSSLLNAWVIPFVKSYPYYILTNANSLSCLLLHSCFWCVLSVLRYMYIVNKAWLEQNSPKQENCLFGQFLQ